MKKTSLGFVIVLLSCFYARASFNIYEFESSNKEQQFNRLIKELRCPKCQNNNLADSNAPLATDIKNYVYHSVKKGESDTEITDFLVARYGEFVTYRPRNYIIWVLPTIIGVLALMVAIGVIRCKRQYKHFESDKLPSMEILIQKYKEEKQQ